MNRYEELEVEVIRFDADDVIVTSCTPHDPSCEDNLPYVPN